jgi:hypothetical protein
VLPRLFRSDTFVGKHAKLLYKLWRIKLEILIIESWEYEKTVEENVHNQFACGKELLLSYEEPDFSKASLLKHKKKMENRLKEVQKEVDAYRKKNLK